MSTVKPIQEGYRTVTPYLIVTRAPEVLHFMKRAFGAQLLFQMANPDGSIGHSELRVGDSMIMLSSGREQWKPMPTMVHLYVGDCDAVFAKAVEAGAEVVMPLADQFYGDRSGGVKDVSEEEMKRHAQAKQ